MSFSKDNPTYINWLLVNSDEAVKRAVVALYRRQTEDEQEIRKACHKNARGFSAAHARVGSKLANQIIGGKDLSKDELFIARVMALKYIDQLSSVARERMGV
jgi:hypothetical protein